jgi:hypothetical protein
MSLPARAVPQAHADRHDGAHRSIGDLERSLRDVDRDDLEVYLALDDTLRLREYLQGVREMEYEKGERWPN